MIDLVKLKSRMDDSSAVWADTTEGTVLNALPALVEVAEAAGDLLASSKAAHVPVWHSFPSVMRYQDAKSDAFESAQARLEEALAKFSGLVVNGA